MSKAFDEFMGGATNTAKDDAIFKFEEDCEREIGGNPVVGISGNYVSVSKDVTFEKAKAGVERFARKQAASVTRSRELGDAYEFVLSKRIVTDADEEAAQDSAIVALFQPLEDAQAELRNGNKKSNVKNVLSAALAAAEKEFKANPFYTSRDKRIIDDAKKVLAQFDADETGAQDADVKSANGKVLKVGSRVCPSSWADKDESKAREVTRIDGEYVYLKGQSGGFLGEWLYSFDAAELAVGAKVQVVKGSLSGGNGVVKAVNGDVYRVAMSYGGEYGFRADQLKAYDAEEVACDDKMAEYEAAYRKDSHEMRARKVRTAKALGDTRSLEMYARVDKELGRVTHDADKSEELEREIMGDVVAVVSGNAARVSKDVTFEAAKAGVESFARKNGVSVVSSQYYGDAYKFKFSAAVDSATDADEKIHYELKGLVKTLRAKGLPQDEISRKLTTYCREHDIPISYLNRSIFDGCEAAQDAALKYNKGDTVALRNHPNDVGVITDISTDPNLGPVYKVKFDDGSHMFWAEVSLIPAKKKVSPFKVGDIVTHKFNRDVKLKVVEISGTRVTTEVVAGSKIVDDESRFNK